MTRPTGLRNTVRERRSSLGWSQAECAQRSGLSRAEISAVETGRLVPSTAIALAIARALDCRVEDLFSLEPAGSSAAAWAWPPPRSASGARYWLADIAGSTRRYPTEPGPLGLLTHDGVEPAVSPGRLDAVPSMPTLVLAGCDPAVGLLAAELARAEGLRLLAFSRSSTAALDLLRQGLVHAAGVHLGHEAPEGNTSAVRQALGPGYRLLRIASWDAGIAFDPALRLRSIESAVRSRRTWVGREIGSAARACLDELLDGRPAPRHIARDHRGVAEAIRSGWADLGVCVRLVGDEAGLGFLPVRREAYDLCYPAAFHDDPRLVALRRVVESARFRRALAELPGYGVEHTGSMVEVAAPRRADA